MPRAGEQIGPYTLVNKLGKGAFGVVWLAERRTRITTTNAALKIPLDDDIELDAIKHEADLWVRASGHPNVLPIIEADIYDDQIIIASEYAPDGSLTAWLNKRGGKAPNVESAVEIVCGILAGLEHLHARNIIHRDLKPANILFQGDTPRLADFGISRVLKSTSQSSIVAGTPAYMAPEAFDGKRNEQTDVWSVGVIFYLLLTGRLPFPQADITSLVGAILTRNPEPLPLSVPSPYQEIIARALAKDPQQRYKSAAEMRAALRNPQVTVPNFQPDLSISTVQSPKNTFPPQTIHPQPQKKSNAPHFIYAIAGLLAVIILVSGLAWINSGTSSNTSATSTPQNTFVKNEQPKQTSTQNSSTRNIDIYGWEGSVSATNSKGVQTVTNSRKFTVSAGDEIEIRASGIVQVRRDGSPSDANGEKDYQDSNLDSPYKNRVGGLEMWIGSNKEDNRYFVGASFRQKVNQSGVITFRVIDSLDGYENNIGSFHITVKKVNN